MKQPTPSILERLSAIITILIFLFPDVSASAQALMERPWRNTHSVHPHNIEYTGLPTTPALSENPMADAPMSISGESQMVLLGGHPSDALNKPVDDVVEFEVLNLDMTQSARITFHKSISETLGLTINGQHFFEVNGTSAVIPSAFLIEGTNTLLFASQLGHPVAILDVRFDVTTAKANGASVLNSALESNFIANALESDNARSSDLSFALKSHQTAAIPLSLSNVTRGATAYRSAASDKVITVKIGVQRTLGQSQLREAQVMYFDYTSHSWQKAFVKEVDHENFMVEADVPGGTDYFAALIKTPEMPEAAAFMPTAISDLEPKTPAEGITLIQPPTANQQGDANVSYPLSLPPGRQGMAPQLALTYSSSGGESWCGYGWNIATQSISVDTRWGVPTFDQNIETEVYSLDGQSLHGQNGDKANRPKINGNSYDPAIREPGPQNFFTRTQGGYRTIIRYGDTPGSYFWVVTDANQTKFYYGTKDGKVADLQSELKAGSNITQWYLSRVEDKWGNVIDYTYSKDTQYPAGIRENGTAMWLSKITYTGFIDKLGYTPGKYTVEFVTSKGRVDDRISMNRGLKLIDDRKLTDVVIKYDNQEVKRYKLDLQAGYFNKTKLAGISEWHEGATGSERFYEHTFDYYGSNELTYTEKTIAIDHRNADAGTIPDEMDGWLGRAVRGTIPPSVLSSSSTVGWKGGRRYGVGYDSDYSTIPVAPKFDNLNTLGYQYSRGDNLSITKHQMLDVNGDGIPDIVMEFATGTKMYRPGMIIGTSDLTFGEFTPIKYSGSFATHSASNQLTLDWTGKVDFRGISLTNSHSAPLRSFTDYNSDGVLDVLEQGFGNVQVRFGRMGDDGALHFESSSENTLNPVLKGQAVSSAPSDINREPLEIVRYWKAPKDGTVSISGTASCVSGAEGTVKVAVQKNGAFELPFTQVTSSNPAVMTKANISVTTGDVLMFRTHYNVDGYEDFISWNPAVTYTSGASIKDGAGNAYFNTSYSSGFLVSSPSTVLVNADDEIDLDLGAPTGYTAKSDLHFVIRQMELDANTGDVIDEKRYVSVMAQGNNTIPTSFLDANGSSATFIGQKDGMNVVDPNSQVLLSFEILSTSNINWQDLQWRPVLRVTNPNCPDVSVSQYPVVDKVVYNELLENDGYQSYSGSTGTLEAFADISINQADLGDLMQDFSVGDEVVAYLTTKSGGKTLSEKAIVITKKISGHTIEYKTVGDNLKPTALLSPTGYNANTSTDFLGSALYTQGSYKVHFEFSTKGAKALELAQYIQSHLNSIIIKDNSNNVQATYSGSALKRNIFYQSYNSDQHLPFLHWGQFAWKAHDGEEFDAIAPADMHLVINSEANTNMNSYVADQGTLENLGQQLDYESNRYFLLSPTRGEHSTALRDYHKSELTNYTARDRWSFANSYIATYSGGLVSPGVLGELEYKPETMTYTSVYSAYGSLNENISNSLSYQESVSKKWGASANIQDGTFLFSYSPRMFMDLNGDRYPDVVRAPYGQNVKVQLTNISGGHSGETTLNGVGNLSKSMNYAGGVTYNGEWSNDKPKFTLESFGGDLGYSHGDYGMVDFNGDGLQDRMDYVFGGVANLELNNGQGFESSVAAPMGTAPGNGLLDKNLNIDFSASFTSGPFSVGLESDVLSMKYKLNLKKSSVKAGLGVNLNGQSPDRLTVDLNGDWLTDIIEIDDIANFSSYRVYINTGTSYQQLTSHQLGTTTNSFSPIGSSNTLGADATRKYTIGGIVYGIQAVKSTEVSANYGYTRLRSSFRDMNGDGAVDIAYMMGNGDLKVYYSDQGLCNKLKTVNNPLGGHFDIDYDFIAGRKGVSNDPVVTTDKEDDVVVWHMSTGRYVLGKVTINDGLNVELSGQDLDGVDTVSYTFKYDGGVYNPREREFQGFSRVETVHQNQEDAPSSDLKFISEVTEYFGLEDISLESFIKHSATSGLVKAKSTFFSEKLGDDPMTKTLLSVERYFYEHYGVNQQRDQESNNYLIDFGAVAHIWDMSTETQTIFNAITSIESISYPDKDERDLYHAQKVDLQYDEFGNVTVFKDYGPIVPQPLVPTLVDSKTVTKVLHITQTNDCSGDPNVTIVDNDPDYPDYDFYIIQCNDNTYDNDTIIVPKSGNMGCVGSSYHDVCVDGGQIISHHRKVTTEVVNIYEDRLPGQTYNGARIALLDYYSPSLASNQTGVLQKQRVYVNSTDPSNLRRQSEVTALQSSLSPSELTVTLNATETAVTDLEYDQYGNVTKVIGAENGQSQRAFSQYDYDATNHQFIEGVTNHFGESTCNVYDYSTGNVLRTTGVNDHAIQYVYDRFNRLEEIWAPRELADLDRGPTIRYEYSLGPGSAAVTYHNTSNMLDSMRYIGPGCGLNTSLPVNQPMTSFVRTATFIDGLGQAVQVKTDRSKEAGSVNTPVIHVSGIAEKNKFGTPINVRADFIDQSGAAFTTLVANAGQIVSQTTGFDYMYRPTTSLQWVDANSTSGGITTTNVDYTWDYNQRMFYTGQTIDGASNPAATGGTDMLSREYVDTYGRKVLTMQADPNNLLGSSNTYFAYSPLSELLTITDPLGEVTTYTYDMAGRQLSETHPDRGLTETSYDKASNVVSITNEATRAISGSITLGYDFNRLISKTMAGSTGFDLYDIQYEYGSTTTGVGKNGVGRVIKITQGEDINGNAFKTDYFKYDELGNVCREKKDFIVPNVGNRSYTTTKLYDSFGRIRQAVYPDGDQVDYYYTDFGELYSITSEVTGFPTQDIISSMLYDGYGNIQTLVYGNGAETQYTYSADTKSLLQSQVFGKVYGGTSNVSLLYRTYSYNGNGMISSLTRDMSTSLVGSGENVQSSGYVYDHMGRLMTGSIEFVGKTGNKYNVSTSYNKAGGLESKVSSPDASAQVFSGTSPEMTYDLTYQYSGTKPHQLSEVISSQGVPYAMSFSYNASGSISEITDLMGVNHSSYYWGQEQWLCGVQNTQGIHHYVYDHAGERVMKSSITQTTVQLNDETINTVTTLEPYTLYVNPYYVVTAFSNADQRSKHYYMGTQRVATDIGVDYGMSPSPEQLSGARSGDDAATAGEATQGLETNQVPFQSLGYGQDLERVLLGLSGEIGVEDLSQALVPIESFYPDMSNPVNSGEGIESEPPLYIGTRIMYWYHPDYVSNVDMVTDKSGEAYELFLSNAWGESLHHWASSSTNSWNSPYRFNSKELDSETGMYYYGARYYDPKISVWLSVDPLGHKFPSWSPYAAFGDNPINNIDPDGRYFIGVNDKAVKFKQRKDGTLKVGRNASADLKYLVKTVNASGSTTAMGQIFEASQNKTKIHVNVESEIHDKAGQLGYGLLGLHQAHDADGNALKWNSAKADFDGTPAYVEREEGVYKEATITIFKGNIEESGGNGLYYGFDVTVEQEVANTFQHESHHDTDKEFIQDLRNKREGNPNEGIDPHQNIHPQEQKVYQEMHDSFKKKSP